jgi:DNA-binding GntR family transcriptional regulator
MNTSQNSSFAPSLSARNLTGLAFESIRTDILTGVLKPDQRLRIRALSVRYKIGTTGIREALSRLVTDGLVDSQEQRGFCVAPVSREELVDLTRTRIQVEQIALRQAVALADVEWESNILSAFHRLSHVDAPTSPEKHAAWALAHQQFHEALVLGCASPWLMRLCALLYDKSERYRNLAERQPDSQRRDIQVEHKAIMDAVMAHDANRACTLLEEHFWETTDIIMKSAFGVPTATRKKAA